MGGKNKKLLCLRISVSFPTLDIGHSSLCCKIACCHQLQWPGIVISHGSNSAAQCKRFAKFGTSFILVLSHPFESDG